MAGAAEDLYRRLAGVLDPAATCRFHHVSTRPARADPLFAAPPGRLPQRTYCESHFLTVSADVGEGAVFVYAIEVLVYTTDSLTTLFVAKADSTGYLSLLPAAARPSPLRPITSTFVSWLVEHRRRPGIPLLVSLFARAQDQYLFPGSVDHGNKHVLDDRALVKWWCKTLDPVLRAAGDHSHGAAARAHVVVPGFDRHETASFFPPSSRSDPPGARKWHHGHPLRDIAPDPNAPPRCLVPHFPDDPKARYLDELDDEIPHSQTSQALSSPSKKGSGMWRSIKTLDQFWDTMAFRQECSSGRLVGFIWLVFTPDRPDVPARNSRLATPIPGADAPLSSSQALLVDTTQTESTERSGTKRQRQRQRRQQQQQQQEKEKMKKKKKLTGPIIPRQPKIKSSSTLATPADRRAHASWPETARGQVVLDFASYTRAHDLLLRLDFSNIDAAVSSTRKWTREVTAIAAASDTWGKLVRGTRVPDEAKPASEPALAGAAHVNDLSASIVRKKRKDAPDAVESAAPAVQAVNVLSSSMIRKKPKK